MLADLYVGSLAVGAIGLAVMAVGGLAHVGHQGQSGGGPVGHTGHVGHAAAGARGALAGRATTRGHAARGGRATSGGGIQGLVSQAFWTATSPRLLFSLLIGFGITGLVLRPVLGGFALNAAAAAGALLIDRFFVMPIWNLTLRFASEPAATLESALADEGTAVTSFDANGQGIVSLEVDGQVVQVLGTLQSSDRALGVRVRAGERVRIEDVDAARNRCTVSRA